jgi:peptidoglycan/xylan/chitin deacetylase (PgdA/CDA1 family)
MKKINIRIALLIIGAFNALNSPAQTTTSIKWPDGKRVAVSLTFDDGRLSQVDKGIALLDQYNVKATFYLMPSSLKERLEGWKKAAASGHEIYSLEQMRNELSTSNKEIETLLGVKSEVFAYPCGQTFIGRGVNTKSYVPIVAELFLSGRGWMDEAPNDPTYCDFAQLTGVEMDGKDFEQIKPLIESAREHNYWLVLAGHEMNDSGSQTTRLAMLKKLIEYAQDPANGIWLAPVGTVAKYVQKNK